MTAIDTSTIPRLLRVADLTREQFAALLDLAAVMKRHPLAWHSPLQGRSVACYFERPSTRARVSFAAPINRLGAFSCQAFGERRRVQLSRVTAKLMRLAAHDAVCLHCLPAHRGEEVEAEAIDGPDSLVWVQAANRLPTDQALLYALVTGDREV